MNNYFNNHPQSPPRDLGAFQSAVDTMLASNFNSYAPSATMLHKLGRTGEVGRFCDKRIRKAQEEDGRLTVKKEAQSLMTTATVSKRSPSNSGG